MRTLLVLNTGNDIDIIEESLLHNEKFFDNILVADRQSYDGTVDVVYKLMETHHNISFIDTNYEPEYQWTWLLTALDTHRNHYDYIVFLDADEFIKAPNLNEFLTIPPNCIGSLKWQCYVPDDDVFSDFAKNIKYRRTVEQADQHKLVYPSTCKVIPSNGNHFGTCIETGNPVDIVELNIKLAHFPIRSRKQVNKKIGYWKSAMQGKDKTFVAHIRNLSEIETIDELRNRAINYGVEEFKNQEVVYDPL